MVNAQEWLNSKFPTVEDKAKVKQLRTYYLTGNDEEKNPGEYWFFNVRLEGELDLSEFKNLEEFLSNLNATTLFQSGIGISKIKVGGCVKLRIFKIVNFPALREIEGLEKCLRLVEVKTELCQNLNLVTFLTVWKQEIDQLNAKQQQIQNLNQEKQALQERMLSERQEALAEWEREKSELQTNLSKLNEAKDTFQKSAEYLRETLRGTEKSLEEVKRELEQKQAKVKELEKTQATTQESHSQELKNRQGAYGVVMERNSELEKKLQASQAEVSQLSEWIGKLESVSGEGEGWEELKKELESAQGTIADLREELSGKKGRSWWWVWVVLGLVGVYLMG